MGYHDRDEPRDPGREAEATRLDVALIASRITSGVARAAGVALVLVGLWAGVKVVLEAWGLYRDPAAVERLARVIDRASHIDALVSPRAPAPPAGSSQAAPRGPAGTATPTEESFRPSYFIAWTIAILLLLLVGKLATWTVRAGGELALAPGPGRRGI